MKKGLLFLAFLAAGLTALKAQQVGPNISWTEPTYNFGSVPEAGGKVSHKFEFTNTGNEALVITNVRPSCGCTTSDYTKEPIAPGAKGYVLASFDPNHRVGNQSKSITVTTNGNPPTSTLRFTVNVTPKPRTVEDDYPRTMGDLRLKTNHLALMKVNSNEVKEGEVEVINTTDHDISLSFRNVPSHIQIKAVPEVLKPQMKGVINVKYDAAKKNDFGFVMDRVTVAVNGNTNQNRNSLSISASIEEDFSKLTDEQRANAPHIDFPDKTFNFGTIEQGETVEHVFDFKNTGKSDLIIRKTKTSCGCTVVNPSKEVVKPGESAQLKIRFNSAGKSNRQNKSITVITNDPTESETILRITGLVNLPQNKSGEAQPAGADTE